MDSRERDVFVVSFTGIFFRPYASTDALLRPIDARISGAITLQVVVTALCGDTLITSRP